MFEECFISGGEEDITESIIHIALADYQVAYIYRDAIMGSQAEGVMDIQRMIITGVI